MQGISFLDQPADKFFILSTGPSTNRWTPSWKSPRQQRENDPTDRKTSIPAAVGI